MRFRKLSIPDVVVVEPETHYDERGYFAELYQEHIFRDNGIDAAFVQENTTRSRANVLRGLHYQEPRGQGKLIRVISGTVFDVAVDVRVGSPHFGRWVFTILNAGGNQVWVPKGFAHGFFVLSDFAEVTYKTTEIRDAECERVLSWNDPDIKIEWPSSSPVLSDRDRRAPRLIEITALPK